MHRARALVRSDHSHGASHGGRQPIVLWNTTPASFSPVQVEGKDVGLDLADFDTAYEVMMHVPLVDGRMFERLNDGRIACYDLRVGKDERSWRPELKGANIGLASAMPIRLWVSGVTVFGGRARFSGL